LTGTWIIQELESHGWEAAEQVFEYQQVLIRNIIGRPSSDIEPRIILGAHYDTRPISDSDPERPDLPTPGANDGGSGKIAVASMAGSGISGRTISLRASQTSCQSWWC
jgi:hypothetical protein